MQPRSNVVVVILALAVIAGVGIASALPNANEVITACIATNTGALRAINTTPGVTCRPGENALTWNTIGPVGPAGPAGPPGSRGLDGRPGLVHGYETVRSLLITDITAQSPLEVTVLAEMELPAGTYLLTGSARINLVDGDVSGHFVRAEATCALSPNLTGGSIFKNGGEANGDPIVLDQWHQFYQNEFLTLTEPQTVQLVCSRFDSIEPAIVRARFARLAAIQVTDFTTLAAPE